MKTKLCINLQPKHLPRTAIEREQKQFIKIAFAVHLSAVISAERYRSDSGALKSSVPHQKPYILVQFLIISFAYAKLIRLKSPPSVAEWNCKNKMQQSAAQSCSRTFELRVLPFGKTSGAKLLNFISCHLSEVFPLTVGSGKTMTFENRPMKKVRPCTFFISEFCHSAKHRGQNSRSYNHRPPKAGREKINRRRIFDTLRINFFETTQQTECIFSKRKGRNR